MRILPIGFLALFATVAHGSGEPTLQFRSTVDTDHGTYLIDVVRETASPGRSLKISCESECTESVAYQEATIDNPVYLMVPRDGLDRVVTLWTTGSAYRVKVYSLDGISIKKVLEAGSKFPPDISVDDQGRERISVRIGNGKRTTYGWRNGAYVIVQ